MNNRVNAEGLPLISIAMCTYNGEKYVAEQLSSILEQTYTNLEVVIIDDCSSDRTPAILDDFRRRDSRITVFSNDKNVGFIENFQRALLACSGEYIALADQDDVWLPAKIETLLSEIGDNLLIYSRVRLIDESGKPIDAVFPRVNRIEGACALSLIFDNCVTGHASLIRQGLLTMALPIPKGLLAHDQWLAIAAASAGRLKASSQELSLYRRHETNAILRKKGGRASGKAIGSRQKIDRYTGLIGAMADSGLLGRLDERLLKELQRLLKINRRVFYNHKLARFLMQYGDVFLQLYSNRARAIRKICRGYWYFLLIPFA